MATSDQLLEIWRDEVDDALAPYLWSNDLFYSYLDDAQKMFCRLTEGIEDSTTAGVTQISVVPASAPGSDYYALSKLILKVRAAYRGDDGTELPVVNAERIQTYGIRFDQRPGKLKTLVQGFEKHKVRMHPWPNETVTVGLVVFRLPLAAITDDNQTLEVDDQHHRHLLLWCKHLAYDKQDSETYDKRKAADYKDRFEQYCASSKREQERARRVSAPVAYGGIGASGNALNRNDY